MLASQQTLHLVLGPITAAQLLEPRREEVVQLEEILDVARGVATRALGQRTTRPVGELISLGQVGSQHAADHVRERGGAEAQERARDLRVEEALGRGPAGSFQDANVLLRRMRHRESRTLENAP